MSTVPEIEVWLRKMGYVGKIPASFPKICNASTAFIWEQIISNAKPRQEVANIRRNVIVRRLREKRLEQQSEFSYPIKEIQSYLKKQELEKKWKKLEDAVAEKEALCYDCLKKNKALHVTVDISKQKIKENTEFKFLLERKSKMLEDNIKQVQETITSFKNVTPVEMSENSNVDEITETLQKCAEKLSRLTEELNHSNRVNSTNFTRFNMSESLSVTNCVRKGFNNKTNVYLGNSGGFMNGQGPPAREKPRRNNKRESLGLLSQSCLNVSDEFDSMFLSSTINKEPEKKQFSDFVQKSSHSILDLTQKTDIIEQMCNYKDVKNILKNLKPARNKQLILKCYENIYENLFNDLRSLTLKCNTHRDIVVCGHSIQCIHEVGVQINNYAFDIENSQELYFIHIKAELENDKLQTVLKKTRETVAKHKEQVYRNIAMKPDHEKLRKLFDLQYERAELIAANKFLQDEVNSWKKIERGNQLLVVSAELAQVKNEIIRESHLIHDFVGNIDKLVERIQDNCEEAAAAFKAFSSYLFDVSWTDCPQAEVNSQEIEAFKNFPLQYNRRIEYNNAQVLSKNICTTTISSDLDLDKRNLQTITTLIDTPYSPPEDILMNLMRSKGKLNFLRTLEATKLEDVDYGKHTSEKMFPREEYLEDVTKKLNLLIHSSPVKEVLSAPSKMKRICDLSQEMPLKNYISDERLIDGFNFKFYEEKFDRCYNNL